MANSRPKLEIGVERVLFAGRWILAPFYLGMVVALALILVVFVRALVTDIAHIPTMDAEQAILLTLSLIDLSLTGNLLLLLSSPGTRTSCRRSIWETMRIARVGWEP